MNNTRHLSTQLRNHFKTYKQALILLGARQVGKTTLLRNLFPDAEYLLLDNAHTRAILETYDITTYKQLLGNKHYIIIDELHLLTEPGRAVKIIYDQMPTTHLIVTGSSALHLKTNSSESMAGRKIEYHLYPLTFSEYLIQKDIDKTAPERAILDTILNPAPLAPHLFSPSEILQHILLFGLYPETLSLPNPKRYLQELADSVLFKDILELHLIDNRAKAKQLLKLLAYQIGNLVNYSELAQKLSLDRRTVERYITVFEESFILYRMYPFSQNKRDEISKSPKIYFYDIGLRNALINNFEETNLRPDSGALFENFIITEIIKEITYTNPGEYTLNYWRLKSGTEVDLVLSSSRELYGIEIKETKKHITHAFQKRYPQAKTHIITKENFY